jgi:hypothetical protein
MTRMAFQQWLDRMGDPFHHAENRFTVGWAHGFGGFFPQTHHFRMLSLDFLEL